ncbi:hypothetical protein MHYP_G00295650 [Metynnis hypsauchen]
MESDSGQYLCAVQVHPNNNNTAKGNWKVIQNITVSVHKDKRPQPTRTIVTQEPTEETTKKTAEETSASKAEKQLLILMVLHMLWDVVRIGTRIHEEFYQEDPDYEESTTSVDLHAAARLNDGSGASKDTKHIHDKDYLLFLKG